jgi:8-oxo-dGTP pyrophosphatase MutT (NUDIX family)
MGKDYAYFQVTTKLILNKNGKILCLVSPDDYLDFPGGRIDEGEKDLSLEVALKREVAEELGTSLEFAVGKTAFVCKRYYNLKEQNFYVIAIYYEAEYVSGNIELSDEHATYKWAEPKQLLATKHKFVSEDEEQKLKDYLAEL